jgi:CheY-like chemotaxis protein
MLGKLASAGGSGAVKKRILVVDDNDDTLEILRALLSYRGYDFVGAGTAEDMLERIDELKPDAVILDMRLPGKDGCEALEVLRKNGFTKPVFLYTDYYDLHSERIAACKPDAFIPKSRGPLPLIEMVEQRLTQLNSAS